MAHIWVIEIKVKGKWCPVRDFNFTRQDARIKKRAWQERNLDDKLRIRPYRRAE